MRSARFATERTTARPSARRLAPVANPGRALEKQAAVAIGLPAQLMEHAGEGYESANSSPGPMFGSSSEDNAGFGAEFSWVDQEYNEMSDSTDSTSTSSLGEQGGAHAWDPLAWVSQPVPAVYRPAQRSSPPAQRPASVQQPQIVSKAENISPDHDSPPPPIRYAKRPRGLGDATVPALPVSSISVNSNAPTASTRQQADTDSDTGSSGSEIMSFASAEMILSSGEEARPARPHRIGKEGTETEVQQKLVIGSCYVDAGLRRKHHGDLWTLMGGRHGSVQSAEYGLIRSYGSLRLFGAPTTLSFHMYSYADSAGQSSAKGRLKLWHIVSKRDPTQRRKQPKQEQHKVRAVVSLLTLRLAPGPV